MRHWRIVAMLSTLLAIAVLSSCQIEVKEDADDSPATVEPTPREGDEPETSHVDSPDDEAGHESLDGRPCSWEEISDPAPSEPFEDLAWISHQVAIGTVTDMIGPAWMEPAPRHPGQRGNCLQIMTDYEVTIERHYRGTPTDSLRVRVRGGESEGYEQKTDVSPTLKPGDRLLLFLGKAPQSDVLPNAWFALGNRVWTIDDNDEIHGDAFLDDFEMLTLNTVDSRIRDALSRKSHILGTRNVTDEQAPIHVNHDPDRDPIAGGPCSFNIDYDLEPHPTVEALAWGSDHIVAGPVAEDYGPAWGAGQWMTSKGSSSFLS
jgi:hypothetical protein